MKKDGWKLVLAVLLLIALVGCSTEPAGTDPDNTGGAEVPPTDTPVPPSETPVPPTDTPLPTDTPEPTQTPTSTATSTATPDLTATAALEATAAMEAMMDQVLADLETVELEPETGELAWYSTETEDIDLFEYNSHAWVPIGDGREFSDFVLKVDVTWESSSGLAVCGLWFRAQGTDENAEHYKFQTLRLSGLPSWDVEYWRYNQWQATLSPGGRVIQTPYLDQDQGSTNTYVLLAEGSLVTVYANGNRLGRMNLSKLGAGQIAFYGWQESGETTCSFDDAWVWDFTAGE